MLAVIDIGSNSVRLMLWANGKSLFKRVNSTRLGEGLASGRLSPQAIERTVNAVLSFVEEGKRLGAEIRVFATAAVRRAENGNEFCKAVKDVTGLLVDVVSGEDEAMLGLSGALGNQDGGIIDIGGGSTEICWRTGGKIDFSVSLDVGAVRLFDACRDDSALLEENIEKNLAPIINVTPVGKIYAIGGTASTLACLKLELKEYDGEKIQDLSLSRAEVGELADKLLSRSTEERKKMPGMDVRRADIIAGGALLLYKIMEKLSLEEVFASDRDNLEGYLAFRGLI